MKRIRYICFIMSLVMLSAAVFSSITTTAAELPFTDVKKTWYYDAVEYVYANGIMNGISETVFKPSGKTTRAQIVTILYRLDGVTVKATDDDLKFLDVKASDWFADAVLWGVNSSIVNGYQDNTFRPGNPVTREELSAFISRYISYKGISFESSPLVESFRDRDSISNWAKESVEAIRLAGIIGGDGKGNFKPKSNATRAEIAIMIKRLMENAKDPMFDKFANIYDLTEGEGKKVNIYLDFRDRINDNSTSKCLSNQILPQLGLDRDVYEIVFEMRDETFAELIKNTDCSIAGNTVANNNWEEKNENSGVCRFKIRNIKTGEETASKNVVLNVIRNLGKEDSDPDDFEPGLVDGAYEEMINASKGYLGGFGRFAGFLKRAENGEPLTVIVNGGSITRGASAGNLHCWGKQVFNWIQKSYPQSDMTFVNAGIDGTGSEYGTIRFDSTVLRYNPDLYIIEFGVNDAPWPSNQEGFETMIRRTLEQPNSPAVMILLVGVSIPETAEFMKTVAEKYEVPVVDCKASTDIALENKWIYQVELAYDGSHPREWFHTFMADCIIDRIRDIRSYIENASPEDLVISEIPATRLTEAKTEDLISDIAGFYEPEKADGFEVVSGVYKYNNAWVSNTPGSELVYKVTCRELFMVYQTSEGFLYSIDGGDFVEFRETGDMKECMYLRYDETAEHTVVIRTLDDGSRACICAFIHH